MAAFKVPEYMPQDLLLIHDLVGVSDRPITPLENNWPSLKTPDDESEYASEDEIETDLLIKEGQELHAQESSGSSDPDSNSEVDSDSDSDLGSPANTKILDQSAYDDDEDPGPVTTTDTHLRTKNEVAETNIMIPDIEEVGPEEQLERVGEIMSIVDKVVIVKGMATEVLNRAFEKALDSDTLLVFQDRKVMGYIYETFGPTSQPLYQVRFTQHYPLDAEKVWVSREVFHVPQRSHFVFIKQIRHLKGSDASNVHDEEPAEDELEFSDDEEEAAYKKRKRKRGDSRAGSLMSSRQGTPVPSQIQDQDLSGDLFLSTNPYDECGPYDLNFPMDASRPPPVPYDDPYSDAYNIGTSNPDPEPALQTSSKPEKRHTSSRYPEGEPERGHGPEKGHQHGDSPLERSTSSGGRSRRGRRDRRRESSSRGGRGAGPQRYCGNSSSNRSDRPNLVHSMIEPYDPHSPRPLSPTSLAIVQATGEFSDGSMFGAHASSTFAGGGWSFQPPHQYSQQPFNFDPHGYPQYIQPHINPRFASAFGINTSCIPSHSYAQFALGSDPSHPDQNWTEEWTGEGAEDNHRHM